MTTVGRDRHIYKALTPAQWTAFEGDTSFAGSPVDLADAFIHLSGAGQLKATLDKWYAEAEEVVLLRIAVSDLGNTLKWEPSRGGADFPHLYAPLPRAAVRQVWVVSPENGVYTLPDDLTAD